ncbi:hypothetical protein J4446_00515 [Candidatus Woesearchaeota archaeon]|nr:hypothetical protein [Candidatus Woesearchaeota archaeon]
MKREIKLSLITAGIYFIFYNLIIYTIYRQFNFGMSVISTIIFFVVYYVLLKYIRKKKP